MAIKNGKKLPQAAQLRQILKRCSSLGRRSGAAEEDGLPGDVPRGHFAVYVGARRSRFIIPVACLVVPEFQELLRRAEEEFGFGHDMGITLPCDEAAFQAVLAAAMR